MRPAFPPARIPAGSSARRVIDIAVNGEGMPLEGEQAFRVDSLDGDLERQTFMGLLMATSASTVGERASCAGRPPRPTADRTSGQRTRRNRRAPARRGGAARAGWFCSRCELNSLCNLAVAYYQLRPKMLPLGCNRRPPGIISEAEWIYGHTREHSKGNVIL
jgi:hypothetical protein